MEADGGFVGAIVRMLDNEAVRGVVAGGLMAILTIPAALAGQLFKILPSAIMDPDRIPAVMALVGFLAGAALGYFTPLPMDLSIAVGMGAGLGSKQIHDEHRKFAERRNGGAARDHMAP